MMLGAWYDVIVAILATYYITYALTQTDGPGGVFDKLSRLKYSPTHCFTCTAIWVGLFVWYGVLVVPWLTIPLALAGAAQLFHSATR